MNVPKLRFKEFTDEWTFTTLKDVAIKVNRVESNNSPIMMISAEKGFILQSQKYSKDMTGDSLKKYITLYKNELAYNHGASKLRPYGSVFMLLEDKARIPFVYHCFKITNGYNKFFSYYLNRYSFGRLLKPLISSTARMDGLLNISFDNYFSIKFKIPQLKEQEKIANFLAIVDKKIINLENTITNLENQKKGLLQQIFSQKLRFKDKNGNNYPNWEKKKIGLICSISTGKSNTQDKIDNGKYPFYVRSATIERSSKYLYDEEATLTVGDGVGTGKVFHYVNGKYDLHQRCYRMFNFKNTHAKYFYYFFSSHFYNRVKRMSAKNSVDSVRMNMISDMIINLPCLEEQTKIADFLSAFDRKLENQKAQLEHWKQIKKGLLQQMFV